MEFLGYIQGNEKIAFYVVKDCAQANGAITEDLGALIQEGGTLHFVEVIGLKGQELNKISSQFVE